MKLLLRALLGRAARHALSGPLLGNAYCAMCERPFGRFLPYTPRGLKPWQPPPLMLALDVVGSDTSRFSCPRCLSHDRERHLLLYLKACGIMQQLPSLRILHIAPEPNLWRLIAASAPQRYVMGDLFPDAPEIEQMDLLALPFAEGSFDLVIANHVLEHVADDLAALREIRRTLSPGGHAILQTPYSPVLERTFEDRGIATPAARLQAYGQEDHVRLHGRDIFQRFASVGLLACCRSHDEALPRVDAARYGVNGREPFFLFWKPRR